MGWTRSSMSCPKATNFMMGDNRDNSTDSRVPPFRNGVGFVPFENLVGRADMLFFSTDGKRAIFGKFGAGFRRPALAVFSSSSNSQWPITMVSRQRN